MMDVNLCHRMSDPLDDHSTDGDRMTNASRDHHRSDRLDDQTMDACLVVNLCLRMNDRLDDRTMDGSLYGNRDHHMSAMDDHSTGGDLMMGVNLCRRMNGMDDRCDRNLDVDRLGDLKMDVNLDASHGHHTNDPLDDHSTGGDLMMGVNLCRRMNGMDDRCDRNLDVDRHGDLKMDESLVAKNLALIRVNRDRMNPGHLQYDHLRSRYRGMSLSLVATILVATMNFHHVNQMKGGKMKMMKGDH